MYKYNHRYHHHHHHHLTPESQKQVILFIIIIHGFILYTYIHRLNHITSLGVYADTYTIYPYTHTSSFNNIIIMPQNMKSLFKPKSNNSSSVATSTGIAKGSGFASTSTSASTPTTTITTTADFTSLYPTISSTSSTSVIVHSNKSHASSNNKANANSSTLLSQHCYIKNGQLQRSSSSSSSSGKTGKQSRPKFPTRTSSFLTRLKSTAKRIRSNDSATTSTSSWCKANKSLSASKPIEQNLYESQQKQPVRTASTEPTVATEATFDIDETSSTVSSAPSSILSNIAQTSYDAFTTSNKTQDQAHNYSIDAGVYADYDDNDDMESIISFDSMLGSNEIELEDEDITYITPLNYNYMYDNNNNEESDQFDYKFDYSNGEQDNEEDSFVNDRELERRELRLELLKNFS